MSRNNKILEILKIDETVEGVFKPKRDGLIQKWFCTCEYPDKRGKYSVTKIGKDEECLKCGFYAVKGFYDLKTKKMISL